MTIEKLNLLGIFNRNQFLKGNLKFWWRKKSDQIKLSNLSKKLQNERLIEINNAYEELKKYDLQTLKNYFPKRNNKRSTIPSNNQKIREVKKNIKIKNNNSKDNLTYTYMGVSYTKRNNNNSRYKLPNVYKPKNSTQNSNFKSLFESINILAFIIFLFIGVVLITLVSMITSIPYVSLLLTLNGTPSFLIVTALVIVVGLITYAWIYLSGWDD